MKSLFYSAAWTECGCFLGCSHEHETIAEADSCIPFAGGSVVGIEDGVMRAFTEEEESEFQRVHHAPRAIPTLPEETVADDPRYAVMIRIRVVDYWTWTTWMLFETYEEAVAHARRGNKVVRYRSAQYVALRKEKEVASPLVIKAPQQSIPPQREGESSVEYVLRFLSEYGIDDRAEPISEVNQASAEPAGPNPIGAQADDDLPSKTTSLPSIIETPAYIASLILSRLSKSEIAKLGRMCKEDMPALLKALGNRVGTFSRSRNRGR